MIKLYVEKDFDIINLSILLAENNFNAVIEKECIRIEEKLTQEIAEYITKNFEITRIVNFNVGSNVKKQKEPEKTPNNVVEEHSISSEADLEKIVTPKFSTVKSGEIYLCDLGSEYVNGEIAKIRPVIVIQNDIANLHSPATIVLPLTSTSRAHLFPSQKLLTRRAEDYFVYWPDDGKTSIVLGEQIRVVSKTRLVKRLGRLKPDIVDDLQILVYNALCFKAKERTITKIVEKPVEVEKIVYKEVPVNLNSNTELKKIQIELLANVRIEHLLKISNADMSLEEKVESCLNIFGFSNVIYLKMAILLFANDSNLTVKTIAGKIAESERFMTSEDVERHLVSEVKSVLKMKKSPTMAFIRLISSLL